MGAPWTARRKRLDDPLETPPPGVCLVPVTEDAPALWNTWVGNGAEGIVLKERMSCLPAWLKLKPKLMLEVVVTGGSAERIGSGDFGEALILAFLYTHPRTGADVEISPAATPAWTIHPAATIAPERKAHEHPPAAVAPSLPPVTMT